MKLLSWFYIIVSQEKGIQKDWLFGPRREVPNDESQSETLGPDSESDSALVVD